MSRPNLLILMPDQMRGDCVSSAGHPDARTPHLDRLAEGGIRFSRAYTTNPLCMPARASFLTGRYCHEHGMWRNEGRLSRWTKTYLHQLVRAGYHTCQLGKAHVYDHVPCKDLRSQERRLRSLGFQEIQEVTGPIATTHTESLVTDRWARMGILDTFRNDYQRRREVGPLDSTWPSPMPDGEALDDRVGELAVEFLAGYDREEPFTAFVGFAGPHWPWDPPETWANQFDPAGLRAPQNPSEPGSHVPGIAAEFQRHQQGRIDPTPEQAASIRACYLAKIAHVDSWVGRILDALEEHGLAEDTVVLFWSDHGEMLCDKGRLGKAVLYEPAVHVPVVLRLPSSMAAPRGVESEALVSIVDAFPTLLELAGCPATRSVGRSLVPVALGQSTHHREAVLCEVDGNDGFEAAPIRRRAMVRDRTHKLVVTDRNEGLALYDLSADPRETDNLLGYSGAEDHEHRLRALLKPLQEERAR